MITDLVLGVSQLIDIDRDGGLGLIGLGIVLGSHGVGGKKKFRSGGATEIRGGWRGRPTKYQAALPPKARHARSSPVVAALGLGSRRGRLALGGLSSASPPGATIARPGLPSGL